MKKFNGNKKFKLVMMLWMLILWSTILCVSHGVFAGGASATVIPGNPGSVIINGIVVSRYSASTPAPRVVSVTVTTKTPSTTPKPATPKPKTPKPATPEPYYIPPVYVHTHSYTSSHKDPTCTEAGYDSSYCSCGVGSKKDIPALGHLTSDTWTTNASQHWKTCTRCGAIVVAMANHADNDWNGYCDTCGYSMQIIPTMTVSPSNMLIPVGGSGVATFTYDGNGELSVTALTSEVATATINTFNNTVTVTGLARGTSVVTIAAQGTAKYRWQTISFNVTVYTPNYEVNGNTYETLQQAIAAVTTSNQTEIKVLQDVTDSSVAEIPSGKNIVLNTNGKKITFNQGSQTIYVANNNWTIRYGILNKGNLTIQGNGELYSNNLTTESRATIILNYNNLVINNSTIKNESNAVYYDTVHTVLATEGSMTTINGGTFEAVRPVFLWNGGSMKMNGGTISASYDFGLILHNDIEGTYHYDVNIVDGTITGPGVAIHSNTTVNNTTMEGNLNISGGTLIGNGIGIQIKNDSGVSNLNANITGGTISGNGGPGIEKAEGTGKLTIGTLGGGISKEPPYIQGKTYGITSNNGFYFYDGTIAGETNYHNAIVDKREPHSTIMYDTSGTLKKTWLEFGENYQVGTTKYVTLEQAINAISSTGTIIVLQDYEDESTAIIPASKTITLDTRGKKITRNYFSGASSGFNTSLINNGNLKIVGGGTITCSATPTVGVSVIYNMGTITLDDATILNESTNGNRYGVISDSGEVIINAGKILVNAQDNNRWAVGLELKKNSTVSRINGGQIIAQGEKSTAIESVQSVAYETTPYSIDIDFIMTGGRIEGNSFGVCFDSHTEYHNNSNLSILSGEIIAHNGIGIYTTDNVQLALGSRGNGVLVTSPTIQGETYSISGNFNFYDGILVSKALAVYSGEVVDTEPGYEILYGTSGDYKTATLQPKPYIVSTHPGMYYGTLKEAVDSVADNGTATVTVNRSVEDPSVAVVPNGKTIILNTNSKEITKTVSTILNQGNLRIVGDGAIQTKEAYENNLGGDINSYTSVLITNEGTLTIDGPRIENKGLEVGYWYPIVGTKGSIVIEDGHVLASLTRGVIAQDSGRAIDLHGKDTTLIVNGGIVEGDVERADAIVAYTPGEAENPTSGTITINGGKTISKFNGIKTDAAPGYVCNTNVVINGGSIKGNSCGVYAMQGSQGNITIKEGATVTASQGTGAKNEGDGLITVGTPGGTPSTSVPEIQGKTYGIEGNFNFYDGIIKGQIYALANDPTEVEEGYIVKIQRPGLYQTATLEEGSYIVSTQPNKTYGTLKSAVDAVAAGETATITVTKDVTDNVQAIVPEGKNIKLDLNGKTITVDKLNEKKFIVNNGTFEIIDSGTSGEIVMNVAYQ